eukprot:TRINITY_DN44972_c0_g1_i1.p1 TRINITY_DN44972_c0_g1~~TRINITY_DN44972_c0_g1_i1.p1  ORF type:complete len:1236 (+),score=332.17 TRINITY_DN44972_c0_g1_i1:159-3866(+)
MGRESKVGFTNVVADFQNNKRGSVAVGGKSRADVLRKSFKEAVGKTRLLNSLVSKEDISRNEDANKPGSLPLFKKVQDKLAPTWLALQRRIARRSGAVAPAQVEWPRLLVTAEEVAPNGWGQAVEQWPDVAKALHRVRPTVSAEEALSTLDYMELEEDLFFEGLAAQLRSGEANLLQKDLERTLALRKEALARLHKPYTVSGRCPSEPTTPEAERQVTPPTAEIVRSGGVRTPPYAAGRSPQRIFAEEALAEGERQPHHESYEDEDLEHSTSIFQTSVLYDNGMLGSRLEASLTRDEPFGKRPMTTPSVTLSPAEVQDAVMDKLNYLSTCRSLLGPDRYALERRRLESLARNVGSGKYVLPPQPQKSATTSSRPATAPAAENAQEATGGRVSPRVRLPLDANPRPDRLKRRMLSTKASSLLRSQTNMNADMGSEDSDQEEPSLSPRSAALEMQARRTRTFFKQDRPLPPLGSKAAREGRAVCEYGDICRRSKVTAPSLRAFTIGAIAKAMDTEDAKGGKDSGKPAGKVGGEFKRQSTGPSREMEKPPSTPKENMEQVANSQVLSLSIGHWSLGDAPLVALAGSQLGAALEAVEQHWLRDNRLTCDGLCTLAKRLKSRTAILDLADNSFGVRGAAALVRFMSQGSSRLRLLDLSRNRLSDGAVADLAVGLRLHARALEQLGLADTGFGAAQRSGPALGELCADASNLSLLDLSYNMLQGEGGCAFLQGVHTNGSEGGRLRWLNLAWNCLGREHPGHHAVAALASIFSDCKVLFHIDIAYNNIVYEDCLLLETALKNNHSLWGLHIEGNAGVMDADGHLHALHESIRLQPPEALPPPPPPPGSEENAAAAQTAAAVGGKAAAKSKAKAKAKAAGKSGKKAAAKSGGRSGSAGKDGKTGAKGAAKRQASASPSPGGEAPKDSETSKEWTLRQTSPDIVDDYPEVDKELLLHAFLPPFLYEPMPAGSSQSRRFLNSVLTQLAESCSRENTAIYEGASQCSGVDHLLTEAAETLGDTLPPGSAPTTSGLALMHLRCQSCWVCGGWIEVALRLVVGDSWKEELAKEKDVFALLSVDKFTRPVRLHPEDESRTRWSATRFLPPTGVPLLVIFQVGQKLTVSCDLPQARLSVPLKIAPVKPEAPGASPSKKEAKAAASTSFESQSGGPSVDFVYYVNQLNMARKAKQRRQAGDRFTMDDVESELNNALAKPRLLTTTGPAPKEEHAGTIRRASRQGGKSFLVV